MELYIFIWNLYLHYHHIRDRYSLLLDCYFTLSLQIIIILTNLSFSPFDFSKHSIYIYWCIRPVAGDHGEQPEPTQDDEQDLTKLKRERGRHRGQREERGEQDWSCLGYEGGSVWSKIDPVPTMGRAGGGGREGNVCPPAYLPFPPFFPSFHPPPPPAEPQEWPAAQPPLGWGKRGRGWGEVEGGGGGVRGSPGPQQQVSC